MSDPKLKHPPLKWTGRKLQLIPFLREHLPPGDRLVEPYVGSGAVFLNLHDRYGTALLGDTDPAAIAVLTACQKVPGIFPSYLRTLWDIYPGEDGFGKIKEQFNSGDYTGAVIAARYVYLTRHGYNGLIRYNQAGRYNVAYGKRAVEVPVQAVEDMAQALAQTPADIQNVDAARIIHQVRAGDVVYLDPPYLGGHTAYHPEGGRWSDCSHEWVNSAAVAAASTGAFVAISGKDTPETRAAYASADRFVTTTAQRSIAPRKDGRGKAGELLAIYDGRIFA